MAKAIKLSAYKDFNKRQSDKLAYKDQKLTSERERLENHVASGKGG